jgi:hypothetical protein
MAKVTDQRAPIPLKSLHSVLLELTLREQKNIGQVFNSLQGESLQMRTNT